MGEKYRTSDEHTKSNLLNFYQRLSKEIIGSDFEEWEKLKQEKRNIELQAYCNWKRKEWERRARERKKNKENEFEEIMKEGYITGYYDDESFLRKRAKNIPQARYKEGAT